MKLRFQLCSHGVSRGPAVSRISTLIRWCVRARYLILNGPVTPQERWEENSGFSPSTLASNIAALICAAAFARDRDDEATAGFLEDYADFLETHVERWTVTNHGFLIPGIHRHYVRINPVDPSDP